MAEPLVWTVNHSKIRDRVQGFQRFVLECLQKEQDFPISEILGRLPFVAMWGTTRENLLKRGVIEVRDGIARNPRAQDPPAQEIEGHFTESNLGPVLVMFDATIDARYQTGADGFVLIPSKPVFAELPILTELPQNLKTDAQQLLLRVVASPTKWHYYFRSLHHPEETMILVFDLNEPEMDSASVLEWNERGAGGNSEGVSVETFWSKVKPKHRLTADYRQLPRKPEVICRHTQKYEVPIHVKPLVNHQYTLAQLENFTQQVFPSDLRPFVASTEQLRLPALQSLKVNPQSEGMSNDEIQLSQNRNFARPNEIVAYIVQGTNQGIDGRAWWNGATPPFCYIIFNSTRWTLAHEVGHCLDLCHADDPNSSLKVRDPTNIMNQKMSDTPTLRTLSQAQTNRMKSSPCNTTIGGCR